MSKKVPWKIYQAEAETGSLLVKDSLNIIKKAGKAFYMKSQVKALPVFL